MKDTLESASADPGRRSVRPGEDNLEVFRDYRSSCVVSDVLINRLSSVGLCGGGGVNRDARTCSVDLKTFKKRW